MSLVLGGSVADRRVRVVCLVRVWSAADADRRVPVTRRVTHADEPAAGEAAPKGGDACPYWLYRFDMAESE